MKRSMVDTAPAKLVTIIASSELLDRLEQDLRALGMTGYTVSKADGRGKHGRRSRGMFDTGIVRIETIVAPAKLEGILAHLAAEAETSQIIAFAQDVEAIPRARFV